MPAAARQIHARRRARRRRDGGRSTRARPVDPAHGRDQDDPRSCRRRSSTCRAAARFRNEAQAAGRLSHPNIVGVHEYGEDGDDAYIAMEYVEGTALRSYLSAARALPRADVAGLMGSCSTRWTARTRTACAIATSSRPTCIVTADGQLKVTDFGIARIESTALTHEPDAIVVGTPGLHGARAIHRRGRPDHRVDIFACGVLLYQMLTGKSPFAGNDSEVMYKVLQQDPTPPSHPSATPTPPRCFDPSSRRRSRDGRPTAMRRRRSFATRWPAWLCFRSTCRCRAPRCTA